MTIKTVCPKTLAVKLLSADFDSTSANVDQIVCGSVDLLWSGSDGIGNVILQASNDETNWCDLGEACEITTGAGHQMILLDKFEYNYLRANYVNTDNTAGTISINIRQKSGL